MKKYLKSKIVNKKPFYWGICVICALIFIYIFSDNIGPASKGPAIHIFPLWGKSLTFIPGILLIFYGLKPNSMFGKLGKLVFDLYGWVNKNHFLNTPLTKSKINHLLKIAVIIILLFALLFILTKNYSSNINEGQYVYLKYFDGSNSKVRIDCKKDSDCELRKDITVACGGATAIAKYNSKKIIEEYNKKAEQVLNNYDIDCMTPLSINKLKPVCEKGVCVTKEKIFQKLKLKNIFN